MKLRPSLVTQTQSCLLCTLSVRTLTDMKLRPSLVSVVYHVSEDTDWCETQTQSCHSDPVLPLLCALSVRTLIGVKLRPSLVTVVYLVNEDSD